EPRINYLLHSCRNFLWSTNSLSPSLRSLGPKPAPRRPILLSVFLTDDTDDVQARSVSDRRRKSGEIAHVGGRLSQVLAGLLNIRFAVRDQYNVRVLRGR